MSGIGDNWTTSQRRSQRTTRSTAQGGQDFTEEINEDILSTDPNSQAQRWESKKYAQRTHFDDQTEAGGMGSAGSRNLQGGQGMKGVEDTSRSGGTGGMQEEETTGAYPGASSQRQQTSRATDDPGEGMAGMSGKSHGYDDQSYMTQDYGRQGYGSHTGRAEPPENQETGGVLGTLGEKVKGAMGDVSKKASKLNE
ncbi:hypothetical protein H112_06656 [Trichophyton rubrum D6]|uniref:Uncharacterized protein n=4 Tax=Trichophyton TaxID=5550 RepID=A0A178F2P6_TRIRU|nr:uncharacterized protein TERG_02008 [Trichophyton rubrum CBS 118892]EZF12541.1 hypothetical protein H100_06673 [Trichophyton rubrum MR850]EZF39306.1 hypothetical protein H102_06640 [Trichophyton rubrum CBS 100081]EZF49952.1 hypothetical protein H103_06664 [Trichophyton rubrum CBS 288.86]EZF60488.1 hypothetical protein H104_06619 [Trichophyton rubrum CBS 289.86]EZF71046.1 hypothetical protein H105_06677 [Trichophyton soudanense CBS 452.61]EZF81781.1 hypothetical protein H110_06661 [Trichophy